MHDQASPEPANSAGDTRPLRLFILGATGRVGQALVDQGLQRGHQISAFVRSPEKLGPARAGLTVLRGDPRSSSELSSVLAGHDAVLSALGPLGLGPTTIHRDAARSTVTAMQAARAPRLLVVSAAMLFANARIAAALLRKTLLRNVAEDCAAMENVVMASDIDWTIVRPPRLTNGPLTGRYALAAGRMPRGSVSVSRADVAHFMLDELARNTYARQIVGMAGMAGGMWPHLVANSRRKLYQRQR
jgi:putative NADH-flavin reductase